MAKIVEILKLSFEFSPKLGVREQPKLKANKESNIKGLFVVGDLADAPIIKVALNQGYEVASAICDGLGPLASPGDELLDVAVIGAGPAGIGAALALAERGAHFVMFEKERPFNTIQNFPKAKFIFCEPREIEVVGNFWFEDAQKEDLIDRWADALDDRMLVLHQPEDVVDIQKRGGVFEITTTVGPSGLMADANTVEGPAFSRDAGSTNVYKARRVVLAIGRRGTVNKLGIPGEELGKVSYGLKDPAAHEGRRVLVVGGGDSAVEAAYSTAQAGADVTIAYRGDRFHRAKAKNQEIIQQEVEAGRVKAEFGALPVEIGEQDVTLARGDDKQTVPNDDVLVFIGTRLPKPFFERVGLRMEGSMDALRAAWISTFALITYLFYVLKTKKDYFPFGKDDFLGFVPDMLKVDLGFRMVDASFWGTVIYALLILVFGVRAYRKYPLKLQKVRYAALIAFQWVFLFGVPEVLAYLIIDRPWKFYALSVPWPLSIWSMIDAPTWVSTPPDTVTAALWIAAGAAVSFVAMPIFVRYHGERFCSFACGCGGLAETLGDFWRHLAPRGNTSYKAEWFGRAILIMAIPVTLLILNDAWDFIESGALYDSAKFAQKWYGLVVDFWLACVIGVAFYPYLGNRVWCRFFCPLRAYMEVLSKRFGKIAIEANHRCIGCGECTRYCQMGIDVQRFAQRQTTFHNGNSACIQCGICIQVCPMEVLSIGERDFSLKVGDTAFGPATGV